MKNHLSLKSSVPRPATRCPIKAAVLVSVMLGLLLFGCSPAVVVKTNLHIPVPVVDPLPIDMAVHFDESLELIQLENKIVDLGKHKFDIGSSALAAFDQLFQTMFQSTVRVDSDAETPPPGIHGMLALRVEEVQLSVPGQSGTDSYEVWFKFELDVKDSQGLLVHTWVFTGYGSASHDDTARVNYFRPESVLEHALELAIRDAGAHVALYFDKQEKIRIWINGLSTT